MTKPQPYESGCRVCGATQIKSRGLCDKHYRRFKRRLDSFDAETDAKQFEAQCLADGWIAPLTKGGRPPQDVDPFADIAASITAEGHANIDSALAAEAAKRPVKKKATKRKKSG